MSRKPLVAGNWKMHTAIGEAIRLAESVRRLVSDQSEADVVLCPPFVSLSAVADALRDGPIGLGAQDVHWEPQGAYTGAVSAPMLVDVGCQYCIIGHSERRHGMGESDEQINKKLAALLRHRLTPILCVGETLQERQRSETLSVVGRQVRAAVQGVAAGADGELPFLIAYEPVWAIGTGVNATPAQAQEVHQMIRRLIGELYGEAAAKGIRILYGGSVKPENVGELMRLEDVDGSLVGGASLSAESFSAIVHRSAEARLRKVGS